MNLQSASSDPFNATSLPFTGTLPSGISIQVRALSELDYENDFLFLLGHLSCLGDSPITYPEFRRRFHLCSDRKLTIVAASTSGGKILGTASLLWEPKYTHQLGTVGHIEDVVVLPSHRGSSLGRVLVHSLIRIAFGYMLIEDPSTSSNEQCYKVVLGCRTENIGFYKKCGMRGDEVQMRVDRTSFESEIPHEGII